MLPECSARPHRSFVEPSSQATEQPGCSAKPCPHHLANRTVPAPDSHAAERGGSDLTLREREILRVVVSAFVDTAAPLGSRTLAKRYGVGLSPASIRNTLSDLEERGYLDHPYTSAGRIPTHLGYRVFVDELMDSASLSSSEKAALKNHLEGLMGPRDAALRETSRLLSEFSNLLGVVLTPRLAKGVLERLEVVPLSSSRVMFVVSVRSGRVRTIVLEMETELRRRDLDAVVERLNERLAGLTLDEIRRSYADRLRDVQTSDSTGVVRLVLESSDELFSDEPEADRLSTSGRERIIQQPEFQDAGDLYRLISLLEREEEVVHLLEERNLAAPSNAGRTVITIGQEHGEGDARHFSVVTAQYRLGSAEGTVGIVGPTRMDYQRAVALVEAMAGLLDEPNS